MEKFYSNYNSILIWKAQPIEMPTYRKKNLCQQGGYRKIYIIVVSFFPFNLLLQINLANSCKLIRVDGLTLLLTSLPVAVALTLLHLFLQLSKHTLLCSAKPNTNTNNRTNQNSIFESNSNPKLQLLGSQILYTKQK